jgi:hypothetical protein
MKFKAGDTLSAIAKKNGTTIAKLMAANPSIKNANSIKAGGYYMIPKAINENKTRGGGTYVGRDQLNKTKKDTNPYKDTNTSTPPVPKMRPKKTTFSNDQNIKSKNKMVSKNTDGGIDEAKGDNTKTKKKSSFFDSISSFVKGEGKKMKSDFGKAVSETKRNFGPGKDKSVSSGSSNITNSSTYKKKVDKKKNLAMQKKQQSKKMKNQMST